MKLFILLLHKELKEYFGARSVLVFLLLLSFFIGYSFITAVQLYSEQSLAAVDNPIYATGFEPCSGIFVPTFGGVFLLFSLFLPFVFIRSVYEEKKNNTIAMLRQMPYPSFLIILSKTVASCFLILCMGFILMPTLILWHSMGGHLPVSEIVLLFLGYGLYGLFIIGVSFFSASIFSSAANASIGALVLIIISWIIDFSKDSQVSPIINIFAKWTVTSNLKIFEHGIFSFSSLAYFIILSLLFIIFSDFFLTSFNSIRYVKIITVLFVFFILFYFITFISFNRDLTESCRNSFSPNVADALKKLPAFQLDIYLRKEDSRFKDFENTFLRKLHLLRNDIKDNIITGKQLSDKYGLFVYKLNGKSTQTYSNSEEEILPLLFKLADIPYSFKADVDSFKGYPIVIQTQLNNVKFIYYLLIPLLLVIIYILNLFIRKKVYS
jgi:ABC-type transport system involved in multi-copper enzyme maturation permease subunit